MILWINNNYSQTEKLYRFYDFGVEIDFRHGILDDDYKYIFPNGFFNYDDLKRNYLYKVSFKYKDGKRLVKDTLKTRLSNEQMNQLFKLTKKQFHIKFEENLSKNKIPPAPIIYDGMVADLRFELQFRGDDYQRHIGYPFEDEKFLELFEFISSIKFVK